MSKQKIFSVHDMKAEAYVNLFTAQTTGMALRGFEQECLNSESMMYKYPDDYTLHCLGEWDQSTGEILLLPNSQLVGSAREYSKQKDD